MVLSIAVILAILIGLATGGSLRSFGTVRFRLLPLVFIALLIQIAIFTPIAGDTDLIHRIGPWVYVGTIAMLLAFMALNLAIPGMKLILLGTLLNGLVIVANGGVFVEPFTAPASLGSKPGLRYRIVLGPRAPEGIVPAH